MRRGILRHPLYFFLFSLSALAHSAQERAVIFVAPGQEMTVITTKRQCVEIIKDYRTRIHLMGQTYNWTLLKGTKYTVEPGEFLITNNGLTSLEIALMPESTCPRLEAK